jgi:tetratricopeptide (TPR) repeat protein
VNTPHPVSEDYRIAQRAFGRGDWETALRHYRNASRMESDSPDILYLIGEAQRMQGDYSEALKSYNQALQLSPGFAPAYLGRALASLALDSEAEIDEDLDRAIELDPNYAEARLQRATIALQVGDLESAQEDLEAAAELIPESPMLAYYRARFALQSGDRQEALEYARKAYDLDRTLLPAYLLLGEMAMANGEFELAQEVLEIYLQYKADDAKGWMALGQSYMEITGPEQAYDSLIQAVMKEDVEAAMQAFDRALELDKGLPGVYLYRAVTYLAMEEGQKAVNDLMSARRLDTSSFAVNLGLGRALLVADRVDDALSQIEGCEKLAANDAQLAAVYYWSAIAVEADSPPSAAISRWQALLDLPEEAVPPAWRRTAEEHLIALTPTATATPSDTPTPTATPTATRTPTRTPRVTLTVTRTP